MAKLSPAELIRCALKMGGLISSLIDQQTIIVELGLAAVLLVGMNALSYCNFIKYRETSVSVLYTRELIEKIETTLSLIKDAETGQRGYLLVGRERYLEPYQVAVSSIHQQIAELKILTADNPNQQHRISILNSLVAQKLTELKQSIELRKNKGFEASRAAFQTDRGKDVMDRIRQLCREMQDEENALLSQRLERAKLTFGQQNLLTTTGIVLAVCLFYLIYSLQQENTRRKGVLEALRESEERFRTMANSAPILLWMSGTDGLCTFFNQSWSNFTGRTLEQELGNGWVNGVHPDDKQRCLDTYMAAFNARQSFEMEYRLRYKSGEYRWVLDKGTPRWMPDGSFAGFIGSGIDITKRKRAEEEIRLLQTITQAISETPDFDSSIAVALGKVCEATGWSFGEAWTLDSDKRTLELSQGWYCSSPSLEKFRQLSEEFTFPLNTGIPGGVWVSKQPEWVQDVSAQPETVFVRTQIALEVGLKAALGVPIIANEQVLAVFVFFTFEAREEDKRLVEIVSSVANQLGLVIQRKRAEEALRESEQRFRATFDQAAVGIAHVGVDGQWLLVNQKLCDIVGYTHEELLERTFQDITHPHEINTDLAYVRSLLADEIQTYSMEKRYIRKEGDRIWINLTVSLVRESSGEPQYFISVVEDISARKQAEQEIRELNADLERRVVERTAQLEAANKELEAFSYSVSHDLRAPLQSIDGFSQALLDWHCEQLDEKGKHYLQRIRANSQNMGQLIDGMLVLSRVTRSEMYCQSVTLSAIVQAIAADLQETQPERNVEFVIEEGLLVNGDGRLLQVLLENLLHNAWKYTSKHPQARIEFGTILQQDGQLAYFVRDDGAGFDMAYADKLFGVFQRLHRTTEFPGTGVGLATAARIVHRHGGKIWAESVVEQGATFYFTLEP